MLTWGRRGGFVVSSVRLNFPLRPLPAVKGESKRERDMCIDLREYKEKRRRRGRYRREAAMAPHNNKDFGEIGNKIVGDVDFSDERLMEQIG